MRKPHLILLIAMVVAMVVYLMAPVFRALVLGVSGMLAIRLVNFWFMLPAILMLVVAVFSLVGNKALSLTGAGVVSFVMLLFMFLMKDLVKSGNFEALAGLIGQDVSGSPVLNTAMTILINPAWGFFVAFLLVLAGLVATVLIPEAGGGFKSKTGSQTNRSRSSGYNKLY